MKITVSMPTRKRQFALIAIVMGLWRLRSTKHDVRFIIGIDDDDFESQMMCPALALEIPTLQWHSMPRMPTLGHVHNTLFSHELCRSADVVTMMSDWTFCLTPHWDDILAQAAQRQPGRVLWWQSPTYTGNILPAFPRAFLEAMDWKVSPEIFPFWWDDTWLSEVDAMIGGGGSFGIPACFAGEHGKTTRGRDFDFWQRVFQETRPQRVAQANAMAKRLGLPTPLKIAADVIAHFEKNDAFQRASVERFQELFGDPSPPSEQYFKVKTAALHLIPAMAGAAA